MRMCDSSHTAAKAVGETAWPLNSLARIAAQRARLRISTGAGREEQLSADFRLARIGPVDPLRTEWLAETHFFDRLELGGGKKHHRASFSQ